VTVTDSTVLALAALDDVSQIGSSLYWCRIAQGGQGKYYTVSPESLSAAF